MKTQLSSLQSNYEPDSPLSEGPCGGCGVRVSLTSDGGFKRPYPVPDASDTLGTAPSAFPAQGVFCVLFKCVRDGTRRFSCSQRERSD